jgi:hypothetical protein
MMEVLGLIDKHDHVVNESTLQSLLDFIVECIKLLPAISQHVSVA